MNRISQLMVMFLMMAALQSQGKIFYKHIYSKLSIKLFTFQIYTLVSSIDATSDPKIPVPVPDPTFPGDFRGGEFALRTSGIRGFVSKNRENNWLRQKDGDHTKPKPGDFSVGLVLYFLFPTSTGFNFFLFVSVQFSYEHSESFHNIFFMPF